MEDHSPTLGFVLHDVARLLKRRFEQNARGTGLTRSQWQVLAHLAQNEGIHQGKLAELLDIEAIRRAEVSRDPYTHMLVGNVLNPDVVPALRADFPNITKPGFLTGYTAALARDAATKNGEAPDNEKAMAGLMEVLGKAGITAETGLKNIAA